jgi:alkylation response protein AidB-like acyl-CoA dehydrogenase
MSSYVAVDTLRFLLFEAHRIQDLLGAERYAHLDESTCEITIQSAKDWSDTQLFPFFKEMDETPARWEAGRVKSHPQIRNVMRQAGENGWIGSQDDFEFGGLQLPVMLHSAIHFILQAANNSAQGYLGLTAGSARLITSFGSRQLADTYVPNMYAGIWQGTMALTEPQAGSSLTDVTCSAQATAHGYYLIKGQKIFISGGDHEGADNFIHLTLARIEGAAPGVKGISLFVIPRMRPTDHNTLEYNDVQTVGDFQKLGQRGYSTTHLAFGEEGDCRGWLVGAPHQGLPYMFQMMNEARIGVGSTAAATAMAAYLASLQYAGERTQGRLPGNRNPLDPPVPIIRHADVQRMLKTQKVIVDGSTSLVLYCSRLADLAHTAAEEGLKQNAWLLLEFLTPIVKTYATEQGIRSISLGLQVLGGYGYTMDFPLQQYYRDIRIMSIYEGTTGIQSLDLLGRKVLLENGKAFKALLAEIAKTIQSTENDPTLQAYAASLQAEVNRMVQVTQHLIAYAQSGDLERFTADATVYMEMTANIVIAWQWLFMAQVALQSSGTARRFDQAFYDDLLDGLKFYFRYELPHAEACGKTILAA